MQDKPTAPELLDAVIQFLNEEIEPLVEHDPRMRFRVLIAANVLRIISREITSSEPLLQAEWQRLTNLTNKADAAIPLYPNQLLEEVEAMNREICVRLRADDFAENEDWQAALLNHLEATTLEKLQITNPRLAEQVRNY